MQTGSQRPDYKPSLEPIAPRMADRERRFRIFLRTLRAFDGLIGGHGQNPDLIYHSQTVARPGQGRGTCRSLSTNTTEAAPRLRASKPKAPVPAKRSSTRESVTSGPRVLNNASRTRSVVGRTPFFLGEGSRGPLKRPAIILMSQTYFYTLFWMIVQGPVAWRFSHPALLLENTR